MPPRPRPFHRSTSARFRNYARAPRLFSFIRASEKPHRSVASRDRPHNSDGGCTCASSTNRGLDIGGTRRDDNLVLLDKIYPGAYCGRRPRPRGSGRRRSRRTAGSFSRAVRAAHVLEHRASREPIGNLGDSRALTDLGELAKSCRPWDVTFSRCHLRRPVSRSLPRYFRPPRGSRAPPRRFDSSRDAATSDVVTPA